ncbi:hypothetical protein SEUCBS139899_007203 [Sporothrix eucalyptigena]
MQRNMPNQLPALGPPSFQPPHPIQHLPTMSLPPPHGYVDQYHSQHSQHPQHSQHSSQHSSQHASHPQHSHHQQHPQSNPPHPPHSQHPQHPQHSSQHSQHGQHAPPQTLPPVDPTRSPPIPAQEPPKPTPEQEAATRKALEPTVGSEGTRSYSEIEHTMFVLNVDLWSEDALKEVNLVRHTTTTPSISSTTPASYEQVENTPAYSPLVQSDPRSSYGSSMYGHSSMNPYGQYNQAPPYMHQTNGYGQSGQYGGYHGGDYGMHLPSQGPGYGPPRVFNGPGDMMTQRLIQGNQPQGMFTRNLIGSLAASAFRLQDPADKIGIWFVLQDLSVRTEGNFRLRFSFVNVGPPSASPTGTPGSQFVNTGKAPVLASCFSEVFTVYSAKKFPGVCESTVLSKTFATQGIKIPIRKEGIGKNGRGDDDDDYE